MLDFSGMNEAQQIAVLHGEGPMLVLAGPGSGKTFTITNRISYLIMERHVLPEQILVITFTKEAALSMQQRFLQQVCSSVSSAKISHKKILSKGIEYAWNANSTKGLLPVNFGTFHAIFYHILQQSCVTSTEHLLKDSEKIKLITPIIADYKKRQQNNYTDSANSYEENKEECNRVLAAISYYKNTGNKEKAADLLESHFRTDFGYLLEMYEKKRIQSGRIDFDDMVYGCLKLLQKDVSIRKKWQQRFSYILIDEFQDINPIQYQVIRLLSPSPYNLFCVGDDDQSIYGFRGSDPSLMHRFLQDYPQAKQVLLGINYRSHSEIVQASLKVITRNHNRFSKELKACEKNTESGIANFSQELPAVSLMKFEEREEEYQSLIAKLKEQQRNGKLEQCAVLFRTNSLMQGFAANLTKAKLPFHMKEKGTCIYDHFITQDLNHYWLFATGQRSRGLFLTIMNKPSRYISRDALTQDPIDFVQLRDYYRHYGKPGTQSIMLERLGRLEKDLAQLKHMKPYLAISFLRKRVGYEDYLRHKAGTKLEKQKEWMELLDWLSSDARQYRTWEEWLQYQESFREQIESTNTSQTITNGVHLMTAHASKGLEFHQVYLPDINEGVYPYGHLPDAQTVEEECRMLYVAMTRAKQNLELLYLTGTKEHPRLPSRFLNPLL